MGSAGWGYTSILILERAVVCQQPDYACVCLPKPERYLGIVRGSRYSNGIGGNVVAEGRTVDEEVLLPY